METCNFRYFLGLSLVQQGQSLREHQKTLEVVGAKGFEPSTSWSRTRRASQAALRPDIKPSHNKFTLDPRASQHDITASRQLSQLPGHDRCAAGAQRGRLVFNAKENAAKEPPVAALDVA
jgi:hypothetical protein